MEYSVRFCQVCGPFSYLWQHMRHLPNILTLANLFCGCAAISYILGAHNFTTAINGADFIEVPAVEQPYIGSLFIFAAALFDFLDGAAARVLKVFSPIGRDLDSLADVVSFGVAPSMILYKVLWQLVMKDPSAMDTSMWQLGPAFAIAVFAALRLARYNIAEDKGPIFHFEGMPTPAVGLYIATIPMLLWQNPGYRYSLLGNIWSVYFLVALLSYLMVSKISFFKALPPGWAFKHVWPRLVWVVITLGAVPILGWAAADVSLLAYVGLSLIYKSTSSKEASL